MRVHAREGGALFASHGLPSSGAGWVDSNRHYSISVHLSFEQVTKAFSLSVCLSVGLSVCLCLLLLVLLLLILVY